MFELILTKLIRGAWQLPKNLWPRELKGIASVIACWGLGKNDFSKDLLLRMLFCPKLIHYCIVMYDAGTLCQNFHGSFLGR